MMRPNSCKNKIGIISIAVLFSNVLLLIIFLLCTLISYLSLKKLNSSLPSRSEKSSSDYKYRKFIPFSSETQIGAVSLFEKHLNPNEFLYYEDDFGNHVLISNFGEDEYQCFGTCFCVEEVDEERKTISTNFFSRPLLYFLTALTTAVAFEKAKNYFESECVSNMDLICPLESIQSDVEYCESIKYNDVSTIITLTSSDSSESSSTTETKKNIKKSYFCSGHCVSRSFQTHEETDKAKYFQCDQLKTKGHISVRTDCLESPENMKFDDLQSQYLQKAVEIFYEKHLSPYCKENSIDSSIKKNLCISSLESISCITLQQELDDINNNELDDDDEKKREDSLKHLRYFQGKQILSLIRSGDFAHAGEIEAMDILLDEFPEDFLDSSATKKGEMQILDVGSGLGGTADYFQTDLGWGDVTGFDLEASAVQYAREKYPHIDFFVSDVCDVPENLDNRFTNSQSGEKRKKFDLLYMFNVFYAFGEGKQEEALECLRKVAKESGMMAIFDYSNKKKERFDNRLYHTESPSGPFVPINTMDGSMDSMMSRTGWDVVKTVDLSSKYEEWYISLLQKLEGKKNEVCERFGEFAFERMKERYTEILESIQEEETGGVIVYAKAKIFF